MPAWSNQPPTYGLVDFKAGYSAGSFDTTRGPGKFVVTGIAVAANVVTLNVAFLEGNIPAVGDLVSVVGTIIAAANVTNVALTGVSITASTGVGTLTYAATTANYAQANSGGSGTVAVPEVGEALAVQKYRAFALGQGVRVGFGLSWAYTFPSAPVSASLQLEGAINNNDAEFAIIGVAQTSVTGYNTIIGTVPDLVRFVRVNCTATSGGSSPTVIAKIMQG